MRHCKARGCRGLAGLAVLAALAGAAGCGGERAPVTGRVAYQDGSPLTEGNVIGQMGEGVASVTVQGNVKPDGSFSWGTERPGDGARPGLYRVAVIPRGLGDSERGQGMRPAVDSRYTSFATSGITFEVKRGRNTLNITVSRPAPRGK
jgi:hypothetical protein